MVAKQILIKIYYCLFFDFQIQVYLFLFFQQLFPHLKRFVQLTIRYG